MSEVQLSMMMINVNNSRIIAGKKPVTVKEDF